MKITILMDNNAEEGFASEHGISLWIETPEIRILFDTGQSRLFIDNARKLGISLEKTDVIVLSHGHYDHTGGLADILDIASKAQLILHPNAVLPRYSVYPGKTPRSIGMPDSALASIDRLKKDRTTWVIQARKIASDIGVTGAIPRETPYEDVGGPFFLDPEGKREDTLVDDQALWINTDEGLVICAGCCHSGLINTLNYIRRLNANSKIRLVIGGFHLVNASAERMERTLEALMKDPPEKLAPCHCTGERATEFLKEKMPKRILPCRAGTTWGQTRMALS
ncbi:MBL fold metallo-hydrolase [Candidatus Sumerlaeota bacterium]|nr:MBL fold metallo-hydrolase [Candidatus Sumerlaeota bacterium]